MRRRGCEKENEHNEPEGARDEGGNGHCAGPGRGVRVRVCTCSVVELVLFAVCACGETLTVQEERFLRPARRPHSRRHVLPVALLPQHLIHAAGEGRRPPPRRPEVPGDLRDAGHIGRRHGVWLGARWQRCAVAPDCLGQGGVLAEPVVRGARAGGRPGARRSGEGGGR